MKLVAALIVTMLASFNAARQSYSLLWRPNEGTKVHYKLVYKSVTGGHSLVYTVPFELKVIKVEPNGDYTIATSFQKGTLMADGVEQSQSDEPDKPQISKFNRLGEHLDKQGIEDADGIGHAIDFVAPPKPMAVGAKWTRVTGADPKKSVRGARVDYVLEKVESGIATVSLSYAETEGDKPIKATGQIRIRLADGSLESSHAHIANARLDDQGVSDVDLAIDLIP